MAEAQQQQQENRKKIRIKTGRRKAKKRVWKTKWVKTTSGPSASTPAAKPTR